MQGLPFPLQHEVPPAPELALLEEEHARLLASTDRLKSRLKGLEQQLREIAWEVKGDLSCRETGSATRPWGAGRVWWLAAVMQLPFCPAQAEMEQALLQGEREAEILQLQQEQQAVQLLQEQLCSLDASARHEREKVTGASSLAGCFSRRWGGQSLPPFAAHIAGSALLIQASWA